MKNYFLLSFTLFAANLFSQAHLTGVVHYQSGYSQKNIDNYLSTSRKTLKNKKDIKFFDDLLLNSKKVHSTLLFSLSEALYTVDKKLSLKSRGDVIEKLTLIPAGSASNYYTSTKTNTLEIQDCQTLGKCFIIVSPLKKWQISQQTKTIAGYTCYKATTVVQQNNKTNHITAWFTPQIPVCFGPRNYNGLLGLILELNDDYISFSTTKLTINPTKKVVIKKPTKGKRVTQQEFEAMNKKMYLKFIKSTH